MRIVSIALAGLLLATGPAWAADRFDVSAITTGYTFYNRPGASLEQHNADLVDCGLRTGVPRPGQASGPSNMGLAFDLVWAGPIAGMYADKVENCMVVRGWRVIRLDDADGSRLSKAPIGELMTALAPLVGADNPPGQVARSWSNLALNPDSYRISSRPPAPSKSQLSLRILNEGGIWRDPPADPANPAAARQGATGTTPAPAPKEAQAAPVWPSRPLKPEEIGQAPPGSAIVVVRVTGIGQSSGTGVGFARTKTQPGDTATLQIDAPTFMSATIGTLFARKEGNWFVLAIQPGRWRISGSGFLDYCLGGPSFEVAAGDVIYAGSFALKGANLGPDLNLAPAQEYLKSTGLADRLKPAEYRNGATGFCSVSIPYALEIDGAPFAPGYDWGSQAK